MIASKMGKSTLRCNNPMVTGLVEHLLIEALKIGYDGNQERVKTTLLNLVGEVIVYNMQKVEMDWLLKRDIEAPNQFDKNVEALTRRAARCQFLVTSMTVHIKHHIDKGEEEHRLA